MKIFSMTIALVTAMAGSAVASEQPSVGILAGPALNNADLIKSTDPGADRFIPVGKFSKRAGHHCTASLIAGAGHPAPYLPALILTAGHCIDDGMHDNLVVVDQPAGADWSYTPAYFIDTGPHKPYGIDSVLYATMKGVDLAVLQLQVTYGELAARGIHPLRLHPVGTVSGAGIELAHIPAIGVPDRERFLRHSLCQMKSVSPLVEGYDPWFWAAAVSNDCQGVAGGTSGSPVFAQGGKSVIGILNTTVTPGLVGCGLGRPCEPTDTGGFPREGSSYYIPVERIALALNDEGTLDVARLDPGTGVTLTRSNSDWITQLHEPDGRPARWNLSIGDGFDWIRYKIGPAKSINCASPKGYGEPLPAAEQPLLTLATPGQEGVYAICVIGQGSVSGKWQLPVNATIRLRQIDMTKPTLTPEIQERSLEGSVEVQPLVKHYEIELPFIKFGPAATIDCGDSSGYIPHDRNTWIKVDEKNLPWRFCTYGTDFAGNAGPTAVKDYE